MWVVSESHVLPSADQVAPRSLLCFAQPLILLRIVVYASMYCLVRRL